MSTSRLTVRGDIRASIVALFERHDIEIPFPQRDLNVRSVDPVVIARARGEAAPEPDPVPGEDSEAGDAR